jgi:hypothetical protein
MSAGALLANVAWAAGNLGAARRFAAALREPEAAQAAWLRERLKRGAESGFGREHGFGGMANYVEFARRVPLRGWAEFAPWVERVRGGEGNVLGGERVTHLAPTSGSSGARKLIPFTAGLQAGFSAAVGAWMTDLVRVRPGLLGGAAYWSVSPVAQGDEDAKGAVRVGYADDAEYLGGVRAWLVRRALAVPAAVRHERRMDEFWRKTLTGILGRRDLRLISVWHPSFLELLLEEAERRWDEVCAGVENRARAAELKRAGPTGWARWWPHLQVVSCWGEQAAKPGWQELRRKFPGVLVQPKGLLATEAVVTIPWRGEHTLAVTSHFFEFIDEAGGVRRAHELERGRRYEVVVTNGGGLWRYRLGDVVECTGRMAATPTLRFLGRAGNVSDLRGEKLSEAFVEEVLRTLWSEEARPRRAVLWACEERAGYELEISGERGGDGLAERLETALAENPHYAWARRLGQLAPARVVVAGEDAEREALRASGGRLGDVKPAVLVARRLGDCGEKGAAS